MKRLMIRTWQWLDDRLGISALIGPSLKHLVPHDARWWYVFGSATLLAFIVQVVTGVALAFSYASSSSQAYETLQFITNEAPFGRLLRGMHYFGASAMVLMVGAHMAQTFLFGSYKFPREMNWTTGVLLLGFTLVMGFTGQLLRWDQTAAWSVIVAAEQAGRVPLIGDFSGAIHSGRNDDWRRDVEPLLCDSCFHHAGAHVRLYWFPSAARVAPRHRRAANCWQASQSGNLSRRVRRIDAEHGAPILARGSVRDFVVGTGLIVIIALLAYFVGPPPLDKPPDPSLLKADPRPDWYLL
jgi:ubiquinol-cytochrome c reductase cytochrome b subunit